MNWFWMKRCPTRSAGQAIRARLTVEGLDTRIVPSAARATEVPTGAEPAVVRTQVSLNPADTSGATTNANRAGVPLDGDRLIDERAGGPSNLPAPGDVMQPDPGGDDNYDKPPPHGPGVGPGPVSISVEDARPPGRVIGGPVIEGLVATSVADQVQSQLPGYGSEGFWETVCEGVFGAAGGAAGGAIGGAIGGPPGATYGAGIGGIIGAGVGSEVCEDMFTDNGTPNGGGGGTEGAGSEGSGPDGFGGAGGGSDPQFDYGDGDDPGSDDGGYCPEDGESSSDDDDDDDDDNESSEPTDEGFPADDDSGGGGPKGINAVQAINAVFAVAVTPAVNGQQWSAP